MRGSSISYFIKEGFKNIWHNKVMSVASVSVLIACLLIMGSFVLAVYNIRDYIRQMKEETEIVVFIDDSVPDATAKALQIDLEGIPNVARAEFVDRNTAWEEYKAKFSEEENLFDGIKENPIRHSYKIFLTDLSKSEETIKKIEAVPGIAKLRSSKDITENLLSLQKMLTIFAFSFFIIFFVISVFIISNTVRLAVFARRREINIMKYVGATNWFIRWPFVIEGFIIGAFGGGLAYLAEWGIYTYLTDKVLRGINIISILPFSDFATPLLGAFLGAGILLGVGGSAVSIRKYLKV